jgi:ribosomal protein S18 acetylase RimI-like enzyme
MGDKMPDKNIFMFCENVNIKAFSIMPEGYSIRNLKKDELEIWKSMPFDGNYTEIYKKIMDEYYNKVYLKRENEFYEKCTVVCNKNNEVIGTCFLWKLSDKINTVHWFKIVKGYEGKGIGRALFSGLLKSTNDFPIFLHTQPESYKAIKLYNDFGFKIITDPEIGNRKNDINECLPILRENMPKEYYERLNFKELPKYYLDLIHELNINDF